jgi:acyl-coenzyme A synthetase/AMP-(fatty) acid ligase
VYAADFARTHAKQPAIIKSQTGDVTTLGQFESDAKRITAELHDIGSGTLDHISFLMEVNPLLFECEAAGEWTGPYSPSDELVGQLIAFRSNNRAHRKCSKSVDFAAELPWLPTGKLSKRKLSDQYRDGAEPRAMSPTIGKGPDLDLRAGGGE